MSRLERGVQFEVRTERGPVNSTQHLRTIRLDLPRNTIKRKGGFNLFFCPEKKIGGTKKSSAATNFSGSR